MLNGVRSFRGDDGKEYLISAHVSSARHQIGIRMISS
jgi:hypothetical protein